MAQVASQHAQTAPLQTTATMNGAGQNTTVAPTASPAPQQATINGLPVKPAVDQKKWKKWTRWLHVDYYLDIYDQSAHYLDRYWLLECFCLVLALLAFAAIIIVLAVHQNKPLPKWPSLISINSLVAIFTAVLKTALMVPVVEGLSQLKWLWFRHQERKPLEDFEAFDQASRGPWGSVLLILKLRGRHLAALGAFIMIVALAIDPFTQQVIEYYPCSSPLRGAIASIPRKNIYAVLGYYDTTNAIGDLPSNMNAAIYVGVLSPPANASSLISINCPSGNCTFPESNGLSYSSLAMCSACDDISDTIEANYQDGDDGQLLSLPHGPSIDIDTYGALSSAFVHTDDTEPSLMTFEALMYSWSSNTAFATRCRLYPCVKSYSGNITNGALVEKELSSVPLKLYHNSQDYSLGDTSYFLLVSDSIFRNGQWQKCTASDHHIPGYFSPEQFGSTSAAGCVADFCYTYPQYYPEDCIWFQSPLITKALNLTLATFFDKQSLSCSIPTDGLSTPTSFLGPLWLQNFYNDGSANLLSVQKYMSNLANTMTATMRQAVPGIDPGLPLVIINEQGPGTAKTDAYGTVLQSQTCIRVHWPWLSLPASLLLLTAIFLAATVAQTPMRLLPEAWKSSSLAALFFGLSYQTVEKIGAVADMDSALEKAKGMRADLRHGQGGWKLVAGESV